MSISPSLTLLPLSEIVDGLNRPPTSVPPRLSDESQGPNVPNEPTVALATPTRALYRKGLIKETMTIMKYLRWLCINPACSTDVRKALYGELAQMAIKLRQVADQLVEDKDISPPDAQMLDVAETLFATCPDVFSTTFSSIISAPPPYIVPIPKEILIIPAMLMEYLYSVARASHALNRAFILSDNTAKFVIQCVLSKADAWNRSGTVHMFAFLLNPRRSLIELGQTLELSSADLERWERHMEVLRKFKPATTNVLMSTIEIGLSQLRETGDYSSVCAYLRVILGVLPVVPDTNSSFLDNDKFVGIVSDIMLDTLSVGSPETSSAHIDKQNVVSLYEEITRIAYFTPKSSPTVHLKDKFVLHLSELLKIRPSLFFEPFIRSILSQQSSDHQSGKQNLEHLNLCRITYINILYDYITTLHTSLVPSIAELSTNPVCALFFLSDTDIKILTNATKLGSDGVKLAMTNIAYTLPRESESVNAVSEIVLAIAQKSRAVLSGTQR